MAADETTLFRNPNFFVIGALACGTATLQRFLEAHPEVFMPSGEIHFFGGDIAPRPEWWGPRSDVLHYRAAFSGVTTEPRIGQRSDTYLYSRRAAGEIKAFAPSASIIAMVRNPIELLYSLYEELLHEGYLEFGDLEAALSGEEDSLGEGASPQHDVRSGNTAFCRELVQFSPQLKRYIDVFGREKVHVIIDDELERDGAGTYRNVLRFLGVDDGVEPEFAAHRQGPPPRAVARRGEGPIDRAFAAHKEMDPEIRARLQVACAGDVETLSKLLDRDLGHWLA